MELKNFYTHIIMCINVVIRLQKDLLPGYQSINRRYEFVEYLIPYRDHPFYYCNVQIYTFLVHSLLVAMNNDTCIKSSMAPQAYKVVGTHDYEISGWTILSRLLHSHFSTIGGMNGGVQYYLATLAFKNGEQLEYFHCRILRIQQKTNLSGENILL